MLKYIKNICFGLKLFYDYWVKINSNEIDFLVDMLFIS